ncbi:hypothetical protein PMIN02_012438 [Paraphaeosphaeria minitans]
MIGLGINRVVPKPELGQGERRCWLGGGSSKYYKYGLHFAASNLRFQQFNLRARSLFGARNRTSHDILFVGLSISGTWLASSGPSPLSSAV